MNINLLAIDIAKNVFQLCAVDKRGKIIKEKKVSRTRLLCEVGKLSPEVIVMEACGSSNYWARTFEKRGYQVKLIAPQYVKPFVKGNKNDQKDARAIAEASLRPMMHFVLPKTVEQQDMQSLLRIREGYVEMRTKCVNQTRGLLAEYGIVITKSIYRLRAKLPELFARENEVGLTAQMKGWLENQYRVLLMLDEKIAGCEIDMGRFAKQTESCQRLQAIEGVGALTAVAIVSHIGNGTAFKNGRHFSAYLGLVPRQYSSGDKQRLQRISKRGDKHLRTLLIHGGRSVVRHAGQKKDARSQWINQLKNRGGNNKTAVAVANKNARIILALLKSGDNYRSAA